MSPWHCLQSIAGLNAVPEVWRRSLGDLFPAFNTLAFERGPIVAKAYPCFCACDCGHPISPNADGSFTATCEHNPPACPPITLSLQDITGLQVSPGKLASAIARAFHLDPRHTDLHLPHTHQFAAYSPAAVPVILSIQTDRARFHSILTDLALRLGRPFLLFAPTAAHLDAGALTTLTACRSAFFPLELHTTVTPAGELIPNTPAENLFSHLNLHPNPNLNPNSHSAWPAWGGQPGFQFHLSAVNHHPGPIQNQKSKIQIPRYSLRKGLGIWYLALPGGQAIIHHEKGLLYVLYLLTHPGLPIHALDLHALLHPLDPAVPAISEIIDPQTGRPVTLEAGARLQQLSLARENRQAAKTILHEIADCNLTIASDTASPAEKAEADERLAQLHQAAALCATSARGDAHNATKAVRRSIHRLHQTLSSHKDQNGRPDPVLLAFADHIYRHILVPSVRRAGPGQLLYEPPPATRWNE